MVSSSEWSPNSLSAQQFSVILAIADAFIPSLTDAEIESITPWIVGRVHNMQLGQLNPYFHESCADNQDFIVYLDRMLLSIPEKAREDLAGLLDLLHGGGVVSAVFTRSLSGFTSLSRQDRTKVLQNWRDSYLPLLRNLFASIKKLIIISYLKVDKPALLGMGYPETHIDSPQTQNNSSSEPYAFSFEEFQGITGPVAIDADFVVVGSGGGGGVVAARLTGEFGRSKKIVIIEKGEFVSQEQLPVPQKDHNRLYDGSIGAFMTADDQGAVLVGSTWGGSTTVNYAGSLELPTKTRYEWAKEHGISFATSNEFQQCFDRVSQRIGVSTQNINHSATNRVILDGARRLNLPCFEIPQNTGGRAHDCGLCVYGCCTGGKQSSTVTWLVDAHKNGAICIEKCRVERILLKGRKATGVKALFDDGRELIVNAKKVIVSAGAIRTPCLLRSSGIQDPLVGKNLRVHPTTFSVGYFDHINTNPWEGSVMTAMATSDEDADYGAKIVNMPFYPGLTAYSIPWKDPASWKSDILRFKQSVWTASIARDRDSSGVVQPDAKGEPIITYTLADRDRASLLEGVIRACMIQIEAGCQEVMPVVNNGDVIMEPYRIERSNTQDADTNSRETENPRFKAWVKDLRKVGMKKLKAWNSAHPQGTCKMGPEAATSVVDINGQVWGHQGLYVADASLVPTATGVNPMLTTMALADWVAGKIIEGIKSEDEWQNPQGYGDK